jgi:hypothetical protein
MVYVQGAVAVLGEIDLHFSPGSSIRVELTGPNFKRMLHWDAKSCYVVGADGCSQEDKRTVVLALKQRPQSPTPPK